MSTPATKPKNDEIRAAIGSFKSAFFTVALFSMFLNVLALSPSIYMLQVYDRVLVSRNITTLVMLSLLIVGVYILMGAMEATRTFKPRISSSRSDTSPKLPRVVMDGGGMSLSPLISSPRKPSTW